MSQVKKTSRKTEASTILSKAQEDDVNESNEEKLRKERDKLKAKIEIIETQKAKEELQRVCEQCRSRNTKECERLRKEKLFLDTNLAEQKARAEELEINIAEIKTAMTEKERAWSEDRKGLCHEISCLILKVLDKGTENSRLEKRLADKIASSEHYRFKMGRLETTVLEMEQCLLKEKEVQTQLHEEIADLKQQLCPPHLTPGPSNEQRCQQQSIQSENNSWKQNRMMQLDRNLKEAFGQSGGILTGKMCLEICEQNCLTSAQVERYFVAQQKVFMGERWANGQMDYRLKSDREILEAYFQRQKYVDMDSCEKLSKILGWSQTQIGQWFNWKRNCLKTRGVGQSAEPPQSDPIQQVSPGFFANFVQQKNQSAIEKSATNEPVLYATSNAAELNPTEPRPPHTAHSPASSRE